MTQNIKRPRRKSTARIPRDLLTRFPGAYLFPIKAGKKAPPLFKRELELAFNDDAAIDFWSKREPGCNWGIALKKSGLIVMDVDMKPGKVGDATLDKLELDYGPLPPTLRVRTPSGGLHYYFRETTAARHVMKVSGFGQDVDSTNYVLIPGCTLDRPREKYPETDDDLIKQGFVRMDDGIWERPYDGEYVIENDLPIADAPDWFAELLGKPTDIGATAQTPIVELDQDGNNDAAINYLKNDAPIARQGENGDAVTLQVAGRLKDMGISLSNAVALMGEHWNPRCEPPWRIGEGPVADRLDVKVRNAFTYLKQNAPGSDTPEADFSDVDPDDTAEAVAAAEAAADIVIKRKQATWESLRKDFAYVTEQEVFVDRTATEGGILTVKGFGNAFAYLKRDLETQMSLTNYIFSRRPGDGLDMFKSFCYMPGKAENFGGKLNLWRPSGIAPVKGDVQWFLDHLDYLLGADSRHVLNWCSWVYRYPSLHPKHALLVHGELQGTGKTVIANVMRRLIGEANCTPLDQTSLGLDHDGWKVRSKLLLIEEVRPAFGSSNEIAKKLHPLISEDSTHVDMKGRNDFDMPNVMAVLCGSNKRDALTMDDSDRRYLIVSTDRDGKVLKPRDREYYRAIYGKDGNGGKLNDPAALAALAYEFQNRDLKGYSAQDPAPFTAAKGMMIEAAGGELQKWMLDNASTTPLNKRLVRIADIVKAIESDAPDIVRRHRGGLRSDIEDILRRKFEGQSVRRQIRPVSRNEKIRVWAIGPDAAAMAAMSEAALNAIFREDYPAAARRAANDNTDAVSDFDAA